MQTIEVNDGAKHFKALLSLSESRQENRTRLEECIVAQLSPYQVLDPDPHFILNPQVEKIETQWTESTDKTSRRRP